MTPHRRRLPHDYRDGRPLFLTWHLHGSLPHALYPPADKQNAGRAFAWMDRYLDTTRTGPLYLKQKHIAELVVTTIRRGAEELGHYNLEAYVVMANHVHLLVVPYISPTRFLQSLKSYTARQANKLLGRTGEPFWQQESYDHWVRDEAERRRIISYIENNPVKAGLVNSPRNYPWSSATVRENGAAARKTSVEKSLDAAR